MKTGWRIVGAKFPRPTTHPNISWAPSGPTVAALYLEQVCPTASANVVPAASAAWRRIGGCSGKASADWRMWETIKKIALSLSVIVLFALYVVQRQARPLIGFLPMAGPVSSASPPAMIPSPVEAAWSGTVRGFASAAPTMPPTPTPTATSIPDVTQVASDAATATVTVVPPTSTPALATGKYRDGAYDGGLADANWGEVEVQAIVAGGRLSDVRILQYPDHHGRSVAINQRALPILAQEAVQAQQAEVDVVTGATDTSEAFIQSLGAALQQAAT